MEEGGRRFAHRYKVRDMRGVKQRAREVIRKALEGEVVIVRPAIVSEAQHAFDQLKPDLATRLAKALDKSGLLRDDKPRAEVLK